MLIFKINIITEIKNRLINSMPFISFITSSWHLDNLIAYLLVNNMRGGIVVVLPQNNIKNQTKYRLSEKSFTDYEYLFSEVYFLEDSYINLDILAIFKYLLFAKPKLSMYLIIPYMRLSIRIISLLLHLGVTFKYIIIDEGIGCYLPYKMFFMYGNEKQWIKKINDSIYNLIVEPIITHKICISVNDFRLFKLDKNNKLNRNDTIANKLRHIYMNRINIEDKNEKCILVFKDFGVIDSEKDIPIYTKLFDFFANTPYTVYVKKHPNDIDHRFNYLLANYNKVKLITSIKSGEELVAVYKPKILIGGYTTVLFSSANIFNIQTISFMLMYLTFNNLNISIRNNILFFYDKFDNNEYLFFPTTYDELIEVIIKKING